MSLLYRAFRDKSRRKPCMESATCCGMESAQGAGWNHGNAVYGIKPQELYYIRASRNAMRDFVTIPYNARARRFHTKPAAWITKNAPLSVDKSAFFVGGEGGI